MKRGGFAAKWTQVGELILRLDPRFARAVLKHTEFHAAHLQRVRARGAGARRKANHA